MPGCQVRRVTDANLHVSRPLDRHPSPVKESDHENAPRARRAAHARSRQPCFCRYRRTTHGGTLQYTAHGGEPNELYISLQDRLTIQDGTVGTRDTLFVRAIYPATINAGSGDDRVRSSVGNDWLFGGPGNDTLDATSGSDLLLGGSRDDTITSQDGVRDRISCGPGWDRVSIDPIDVVGSGCEIVNGPIVAALGPLG